ncbi:redoxin domain-containing protein [Pontivivens ytuae]|uniref:Redoxin domain-containing protein n=1 Tax=Pontivivens ytuae TaxID=2789856 RepID=A0A7S9QEF5_9RHOB|nr:redoxin domain-containing protein [Pontivivens ytuae]QPH55910.1 redoxin domain-containing protein [Pontivivens ytuae]
MIVPAQVPPPLTLPLVGGGTWDLAQQSPENFTIIVFYRGKHCPICGGYLPKVEAAMEEFAEVGADVVAVSMDVEERATASYSDWGLTTLPVAFGMTAEVAKAWGLWLSSKREGSSEPNVFAEPGLVVLDKTGKVFFVEVQNAPFTRPPLDQLVKGLKYVLDNDYPTRGTYTG